MIITLGSDGEALIKSFEQFRSAAYLDSRNIPTIGWGHTKGVKMGDTCTMAQAEIWFHQDTQTAASGLVSSVTATLAQYQEDALISFTFNVGVEAEQHSTMSRLVNVRDFAGASAEFPKWNHVDGVVNAGLTRRRAAEQALFNNLPWRDFLV